MSDLIWKRPIVACTRNDAKDRLPTSRGGGR
jgi:hypothetical protein